MTCLNQGHPNTQNEPKPARTKVTPGAPGHLGHLEHPEILEGLGTLSFGLVIKMPPQCSTIKMPRCC